MTDLDPSWKHAVELDFWSYADWTSRTIEERFLQSLLRLELIPSRFGDEEPPGLEFVSSRPDSLWHLWSRGPDQLTIHGHRAFGFQAIVHLNPDKGDPPHFLHLAIHEKYFEDGNRVAKFLEVSEELYSLLGSVQGDIGHRQDRENKTVVEVPLKIGNRTVTATKYIPANPAIGLSGIYWANFFGHPFVEFFSETKLESAPCYRKKKLIDGGYLLLTSKSPLDYTGAEARKFEQALFHYLGEESFLNSKYPERIPKSPLAPRHENEVKVQKEPRNPNEPLGPDGTRSCPKCGELQRVSHVSSDQVNRLIGFRCQKCGAVWAVHTSLLSAHK